MRRFLEIHPFGSLVGVALVVQAALLAVNWQSGFVPFLHGDRSYVRFEALKQLVASPASDWLHGMAYSGMVPSEFIFGLPGYWLGGISGVIVAQVLLAIAAAVCVGRLGALFVGRPCAAFWIGLAYLLLPHNLAFPQQFVTEAVATPCCVFFLFCSVRYFQTQRLRLALWAGLWLGLAIFIRPSLALIIPAVSVLTVVYQLAGVVRGVRGMALACAVALVPLFAWVGLFHQVTGQWGYTSGVANLGWNLRSKVYLVSLANELPRPPEVSRFRDYPELYADPRGIGIGRFGALVAEHPLAYAKTALVDVGIVFGRGGSTKVTVDLFGLGAAEGIKTWRDVAEAEGTRGMLSWARERGGMVAAFAVEIVWSLVVVAGTVVVFWMVLRGLLQPKRFTGIYGRDSYGLVIVMASILVAVMVSGQIVDRAQSRIRHPAEAGMLVLLALGWDKRNKISAQAATEL